MPDSVARQDLAMASSVAPYRRFAGVPWSANRQRGSRIGRRQMRFGGSRENSRVTLTGKPSRMTCSTAHGTYHVPGILMSSLALGALSNSLFATWRVCAVSSSHSR